MGDSKIVVAALMGKDLFSYISEQIRDEKNANLYNCSDMDIESVREIAGTRVIDLAIVDFDVYKEEGERSKLEELFKHGALDSNGSMTDFIMIYNKGNANELYELNRMLLERKIAMSNVCLDDKDDELEKRIVIQNILAGIHRLKREKSYYDLLYIIREKTRQLDEDAVK